MCVFDYTKIIFQIYMIKYIYISTVTATVYFLPYTWIPLFKSIMQTCGFAFSGDQTGNFDMKKEPIGLRKLKDTYKSRKMFSRELHVNYTCCFGQKEKKLGSLCSPLPLKFNKFYLRL